MLHDLLARLSAFGYAPLSPADRFFVGYLAVALVLAVVVLRRDRDGKARAPRQLLASLFPRRVFLHASALLDYRFVLVNYYVIALLVAAMFLSAVTTSGWMLAAIEFGRVGVLMVISCDVKMTRPETQFDYVTGNVNPAWSMRTLSVPWIC